MRCSPRSSEQAWLVKFQQTEGPMPNTLHAVFYNDRGLRAGWRLAIFLLMIFGTASLAQLFIRRAGPVSAGPNLQTSSPYLLPLGSGLAEFILFLVLLFFSW